MCLCIDYLKKMLRSGHGANVAAYSSINHERLDRELETNDSLPVLSIILTMIYDLMQFQEKTRSAKEGKWRIHEGRGGGKQGNTRNTENGVKDEVLERKEMEEESQDLDSIHLKQQTSLLLMKRERKEISFSCQEIKNEIEPTSTSSLFSPHFDSCCLLVDTSYILSLSLSFLIAIKVNGGKETTCVCLLIFCLHSNCCHRLHYTLTLILLIKRIPKWSFSFRHSLHSFILFMPDSPLEFLR